MDKRIEAYKTILQFAEEHPDWVTTEFKEGDSKGILFVVYFDWDDKKLHTRPTAHVDSVVMYTSEEWAERAATDPEVSKAYLTVFGIV